MDAPRRRYSGFVKVRRVGILLYDLVEALDVAGPADVFASANGLLPGSRAPYELISLAARRGRITSESGICFYADNALGEAGPFDTIIVPGGKGVRLNVKMRAHIAKFVLKHAERARRVASVCTGIYALADTGLLNGRNVTTHWRYASDVQRRWPKLAVDADSIYVKDGKFYTSAGVTAGIDLGLAFVEEDFGRDLALAVAHEIVVYLKRSGGQLQHSGPLLAQTKGKAPFNDLAQWIHGNLAAELTLEALAEQADLSPRHFARKFKTAFGVTPAAFVEEMRLDEARWLLANGADSIAELAQTVGYASDDTFRRAFERRYGIGPADYRRRH